MLNIISRAGLLFTDQAKAHRQVSAPAPTVGALSGDVRG